MIRLTKLTDYGIALMTRINRDAETGQMTARRLSGDTGLPLPTVSKILKLLAQSGLLTSRRGATGGYSLSRPADRITIVDLVTALEGPMTLTECISEEDECACQMGEDCGLKMFWSLINRDLLAVLGGYTLQNMTETLRAECPVRVNEMISGG